MDAQEQYLRQLTSLFRENGHNPEENQLERLSIFTSLISKKNLTLNLISRKDINSVVENHIFISAYLNVFLPDKINNFLDIGTGGGLPGLPLAIVRPTAKGLLVDSIKKKVTAVNEFINKLKISNVTAENSRVENPEFIIKYSNSFDLVVSRATVPLIMLISYSLPLIKEKAFLASIKGGDLGDEIKKAELKYKTVIKKLTVFELSYKPNNIRNEKGKKLLLLELNK
ncbi:MAG: 16S rRNA (guanine(527)-N(7))-methyltransferase RsmG [Ignavibacteriales bacterium]|nr:16S rRNA (guanine(527)-N(7))-methyltransferase RsmG [Ignavibacteriales bacterium]